MHTRVRAPVTTCLPSHSQLQVFGCGKEFMSIDEWLKIADKFDPGTTVGEPPNADAIVEMGLNTVLSED